MPSLAYLMFFNRTIKRIVKSCSVTSQMGMTDCDSDTCYNWIYSFLTVEWNMEVVVARGDPRGICPGQTCIVTSRSLKKT